MDLTESVTPNSAQINADDLTSGPRTVTITAVKSGNAEQPVDISVAEYEERVYRPSKSMRRVMIAAWGPDANAYVGRRLTLFRNPDIKFGPDVVGGIQISHMSDIDKPISVALMVTRGKRKPFTVQPLKVRDWLAELKLAGTDLDAILALGSAAAKAHAPEVDAIRTRYNEIKG